MRSRRTPTLFKTVEFDRDSGPASSAKFLKGNDESAFTLLCRNGAQEEGQETY